MENTVVLNYVLGFLVVLLSYFLYSKQKKRAAFTAGYQEGPCARQQTFLYLETIHALPTLSFSPEAKLLFFLGYHTEEFKNVLSIPLEKFLHPQEREKIQADFQCAKTQPKYHRLAFQLRHKSGTWIWVQAQIRYLEKTNVFECLLENLSFQKNLSAQLQKVIFETNMIAHFLDAGIASILLDENYSLLYANDSFFKILRHSREEFNNKFNNKLKPLFSSEIFKSHIDKSLKNPFNQTSCELRLNLAAHDALCVQIRGYIQKKISSKPVFSFVLLDITERKFSEAKWQLESERYRIATELTNDIIFEYNILTDTMLHTQKYTSCFHAKPLIHNFSEIEKQPNMIHPEDLPAFKKLCIAFRSGLPSIIAELRILNKNKQYGWYHIQGKTLYNGDGSPSRIIGKIVDVDVQKKELERLQRKAHSDSLTNLYNKSATQTFVDLYLQKSPFDYHVLMMIDLDNFKTINDTCGHLFGDEVLLNVTKQLKALFGNQDIIGRIGGDKFVVFMGNVVSLKDIQKKASAVGRVIRKSYYFNSKKLEISCSIGISIYPIDGQQYTDLLSAADHALYETKNQGKNHFSLFQTPPTYTAAFELQKVK